MCSAWGLAVSVAGGQAVYMALLPGMSVLLGGGAVIEYIIFIRNKHGLLIGKFIKFFKDERGDVKETLGGTAGQGPAIWFHCS